MKFYSETLKKLFDTEAELTKAEKVEKEKLAKAEAKKKALTEQRSARAKEVEQAFMAAKDAHKEYIELRNKFIEDYGSFHMSYNTEEPIDEDNISLVDLCRFLFN